jgi:hypothetical protein
MEIPSCAYKEFVNADGAMDLGYNVRMDKEWLNKVVLGVVCLTLVAGCSNSHRSSEDDDQTPTASDAADEATLMTAGALAGVTTDNLIDSLVDLTSADYAIKTNIIGIGKIWQGADKLPAPLVMLQNPGPKPSDAVQELTRRGALAVPDLVSHLGDTRPTKVPVPMMGHTEFLCEYDYNHSTMQCPPGVNKPDGCGQPQTQPTMPSEYAVGDICFDILGQIVNRQFNSVRYQPTMIIVINRPSIMAEVRNAATHEWGALTPELHRHRLMEDISHPDYPERAKGARKLMARYYATATAQSSPATQPAKELGNVSRPDHMSLLDEYLNDHTPMPDAPVEPKIGMMLADAKRFFKVGKILEKDAIIANTKVFWFTLDDSDHINDLTLIGCIEHWYGKWVIMMQPISPTTAPAAATSRATR